MAVPTKGHGPLLSTPGLAEIMQSNFITSQNLQQFGKKSSSVASRDGRRQIRHIMQKNTDKTVDVNPTTQFSSTQNEARKCATLVKSVTSNKKALAQKLANALQRHNLMDIPLKQRASSSVAMARYQINSNQSATSKKSRKSYKGAAMSEKFHPAWDGNTLVNSAQ